MTEKKAITVERTNSKQYHCNPVMAQQNAGKRHSDGTVFQTATKMKAT